MHALFFLFVIKGEGYSYISVTLLLRSEHPHNEKRFKSKEGVGMKNGDPTLRAHTKSPQSYGASGPSCGHGASLLASELRGSDPFPL